MVDLLNTKFSQPEQEERVPVPFPPRRGEVPSLSRGESLFNQFRGRINRRFFICLAGALLTATVLVYLFVINPAAIVYTKAMRMGEPVGRLQAALDQGDLALVEELLQRMEVELSELKDLYQRLGYLKIIPVARGYYGDGKHFLEAASFSLEGGKALLGSISPFSDVLGLTEGFGSYLTTEQHLAKLAEVVPQIAPQIDAALGKLFLVKTELDQVDPSRYPEEVRGVKIRFWLEEAQKILSEFEPVLAESKAIVEILPHLLGTPERTYLVLFQNDAELRATGGFMTGFLMVTVKNGLVVRNEFHAGAYVERRVRYTKPPAPVGNYLRVARWHFQDRNYSPDFPISVGEILKAWEGTGLPKIAGVVAINTQAASKILAVAGPMKFDKLDIDFGRVDSVPEVCRSGGDLLTSENLLCRLEYYAEKVTPTWQSTEERKSFLGDLASDLISKMGSVPVDRGAQLIDLGFELLREKDLLIYLVDEREQSLVGRLGYAGNIMVYPSTGDYLHISDSNFGGLKTDMFMQESVEQELTQLESGIWRKTVRVKYFNPQPYDGWLSGNYKDFVRIYVPKGSKLVSVDGASQIWTSPDTRAYRILNPEGWTELGKTVFAAYFTLRPQKEHTLTFVYDLPSSVAKAMEETKSYKLLVQKQPGTNITLVKVKIDGKMRAFDLKTDREITIPFSE